MVQQIKNNMPEVIDFKKVDGVYLVDFDGVSDFPIKESTLLDFIEHTEVVCRMQCINYLEDNSLEVIKDFLKHCDHV